MRVKLFLSSAAASVSSCHYGSFYYIKNMATCFAKIFGDSDGFSPALTRILAPMVLAAAFFVLCCPQASSQGLRGDGDFEFFLDQAAFAGMDEQSALEIFFHIPNSEIRFKKSKGIWTGKVRMALELRGEDGQAVVSDSKVFEFFENDERRISTPLAFQIITSRYSVDPGKYRLSCLLEDVYSPKVTLLGMVKGKHKSSSIRDAQIEVPAFGSDRIDLSDPKFLWKIERKQDGKFLHPNPPRMYGLYNDTLRIYYELYVPQGTVGDVRFKTLILDDKGEVVRESEKSFAAAENALKTGTASPLVYPVLIAEDLMTIRAGTYTLYGQFGVGEGPWVRMRGGKFNIAWEMRTWEASKKNLLAEAKFLLGDEEFQSFKAENRAEQEKILKALWKSLDPNPQTGVNEAYEEFLRRMDYSNANYSDYQLGVFTDRGLIYLRYGKPSEIIVDVIPMNRETTSDAIEKVKDKYHPVIFSTHGGRPFFGKPSRDVVMDKRRIGSVGEGGNVAFPYELWIYNGGGKPILERNKVLSPDIGLRFIFVDREGYGRYKLEVSSSLLDER